MERMKAWWICLVAAFFFSYELVQLHMLNSISPMLMESLHLNAKDFSMICSTYLLADVIFLIPAGIILDRFSARKVILYALGFCILGTVGFASSTTFWQACLFHFISGIGNAFCFLSCMILASSWFPKKSSLVMSVMITIALLGGVIAQVPFSVLAQRFGWQKTLHIDAFLGAIVWILNFLFVYESPQYKREARSFSFTSFRKELFSSASSGQTWKCGLYTGLMNLPLMIISAMIGNLYLTQVRGFELVEASWITSMISLGTIVGSPLYGFLGDFGKRRPMLMLYGAALSFALFLFIIFVDNLTSLSLAALFFALGLFSSSQVLSYPIIAESAPQKLKGTSMGVAAIIIMGLALIGQPMTGYLLDWSHFGDSQIYSKQDFLRALIIFPISFFISAMLSWQIKDKETAVSLRKV